MDNETFTYHGPAKPPITIQGRTWPFICSICHLPGEGLAPRTLTHPGACREERKRQEQARALARRRRAPAQHGAARP